MKIDKSSFNVARPQGQPMEQDNAPDSTDHPTIERAAEPTTRHTWEPRSKRRSQSMVVLVTLLVLAFGTGLLGASLLQASDVDPDTLLSPLPPAAVDPSPTPVPTATATSLESGDVLDTLYVEILPADYAKLAAKREEALKLGILLAEGSDYVPATLRFNHQEIPVELRLKGDWMDHYAHDKWSFRVRTLEENYLLGMRTFSLQDPSTRSYLNEWLFLENLRLEDVLAVRYHFVHVVLNGEYKGIYAMEEGFSKELFESQERREGLIIRYDEDLVWEYRAFYDDQVIPPAVNRFYIIDEFDSGRITSDPVLVAQRDAAVGLLRALWQGERPAAQVFDVPRMAKFLALTDLWSAPHGLIWHNLRYYYNPVTALLEPIAFDTDALMGELDQVGLLSRAFYQDPYLKSAYLKELQRIAQPEYWEMLKEQLGNRFATLQSALESEFGPEPLASPWPILQNRQNLIRQTLDPHQTVYAYIQRAETGRTGRSELPTTMDVGNLLPFPLQIVALELDDTRIPASRDWVLSESLDLLVAPPQQNPDAVILRSVAADADFLAYAHLQLPPSLLSQNGTEDLEIVTRLWGLREEHIDPVLPGYPTPMVDGPLPESPTLVQALDHHPYLSESDSTMMLKIEPGTWDIKGNLILPAGYGLHIAPGTTLRFERDAYLLARGPLDFQGTVEAPIRLEPADDAWKGIVVLEANAPSAWNHVTVESASAIDQEGWLLTGAVTFYQSPIRLAHSHLLNSRAEDAINVIHTSFEFVQSEFGATASDAFDADFATGIVEDCSFYDIGGDAIDISGSQVQVRRIKLAHIDDKGLSVGENSELSAEDVHFEAVRFGLVSKDLSRATLTNAIISNVQEAALAAYTKKPAYGPASLTAQDIHFINVPQERQMLIQTGSWIELEGTRVWGTKVDVDALYP